jgi:hypothetical protein
MATIPGQRTTLEILGLVSEEYYGKATPDAQDRPSLANFKLLGNQAYQDVCTELGWNWLFRISSFNTVPNQTQPYDLDPGVQELLWMTIPSLQYRLNAIAYRDWVVNWPGQYQGIGACQPSFYVLAPPDTAVNNLNRVYLGPGPADKVYEVTYGYFTSPAELTFTGTEYPVIPAQWQDLWRYRWLMQLYRYAGPGSEDKLKLAQMAYQDTYRRAWTNDMTEEDSVQRFRDLYSENAAYPGRNIGFYLYGRY